MAKTPETSDQDREMHAEISALIGSIAKAFEIPESEAIEAAERGAIAMDFGQDSSGNRFVAVTYNTRTVRIYQGAIKYPKEDE